MVSKSKPKIVKNVSKYQIGAIPVHKATEHLFTLKSVIALYDMLNVPLLVQFYDLKKYFDSESLKDAMNALYHCGIKGKLYRLFFELNKSNNVNIQTTYGMTESAETGENVSQGSVGGGLILSSPRQ